MLGNSDWRFTYSALLALSHVGEHVENMDDVAPIVHIVMKYLNADHVKVRWAALQVIVLLSEDCHPEFQIKFHQQILPALLDRTQDAVPRVLAHVFIALATFVECLPEEFIKNCIEPILNTLIPTIQESRYQIVREGAMSALSATVEASKTSFRPYFEKCMPVLFEILKTCHQKEQKRLRGQCIECLTFIANSVGKDHFNKYINELIQAIICIQKNDITHDGTDPQRSYILSGWQRLCLALKDDFIPYLELLLPSLYDHIERIITNVPKDPEESEFDVPNEDRHDKSRKDRIDSIHRTNVNTFDHGEAEVAINMIHIFINELKKGFIPFVENTIVLVLKAVSFTLNNNIRENAAKCLPDLLQVVKDSDYPTKDQILLKMAYMFLESLWKEVEIEFDPETIRSQIYALKDCIEVCGCFMNEKELEQLSTKILTLLSDSDRRKTESRKYKSLNEDQDVEDDVLEGEDDDEEDLHVGLAELIGVLFKTHKEMTLPLVNILYTQVLSKALQPSLSDKMHKFGLFLIDDMIEFLGVELIPDIWPHLSEALLRYANDRTTYVRQAALYGIGLVAQGSKESFGAIADVSVQKVVDAMKMPQGNETDKLFNYARDNAIATLGKIIQTHNEKLNSQDLTQLWFSQLPLKIDKPEAHGQHELLVDIILQGNAATVIGQNGEGISHLVKVFATIIDTKTCTDVIKGKIAKVLKGLAESQTQRLEQSVGQLSELQKQRISKTLAL